MTNYDRPISFRLSKDAREALERAKLPGESLNLCAQRLLMIALGVDSSVDKNVDNTVDSVYNSVDITTDEDLIDRLTPAISAQVQAQVESRLGDLVTDLIGANLPVILGEFIEQNDALALLNKLRSYPKFKKLDLKDVELIFSLLRGDS